MNKNKTVLIVEDEKDLLDSYRELVETAGLMALTASDGYQALDLLAKNLGKIDIIVLDLMMPGVDGLENRAIELTLVNIVVSHYSSN